MQDQVHHHDDSRDGSSDASPGGMIDKRRPGELLFTVVLVIFSAILLWNAYKISGFETLSGAGSVPMGTAAAMFISACVILLRTGKLKRATDETMMQDITPPLVIVLALFLIAYSLLLTPLGFLPTSALFLITAIKLLSKRSWGYSIVVSLGSLTLIYLIFRIVFTVLMPAGIVPEAEVFQFFRNMF
jgi:hypothetical protein